MGYFFKKNLIFLIFREFLRNDGYKMLKQVYPFAIFMVREAPRIEPKIYARFG